MTLSGGQLMGAISFNTSSLMPLPLLFLFFFISNGNSVELNESPMDRLVEVQRKIASRVIIDLNRENLSTFIPHYANVFREMYEYMPIPSLQKITAMLERRLKNYTKMSEFKASPGENSVIFAHSMYAEMFLAPIEKNARILFYSLLNSVIHGLSSEELKEYKEIISAMTNSRIFGTVETGGGNR